MNRWTRYLLRKLPRTGRLIAEDGTHENEADALRARIEVASLNGTLYRGFWQGEIAGGTTEDFVLDVPAGYDLLGFIRTTEILDEDVFSQFLTCTGYTSAEGPILGKSLDRRTGKKSDSLAELHRASALTGVIEHGPLVIFDTISSKSSRLATTQTEAGALPAFDENELPAFRYVNETGATAKLSIYLFWAEVPQIDV